MHQKKPTISVVIPTLNRKDYIANLVKSIVKQSLLPNQLIIVDQNKDNSTKDIVTKLVSPYKEITLSYIHDSSFNSLVKAKDIGSKNATEDIISFLDDDVILDEEYLEYVAEGFNIGKNNILGCMGYITNNTKKSTFYLFIQGYFFLGMFSDQRPSILSSLTESSKLLIPCNVLSGGASSWRRAVFKDIKFDIANKLHYFEDIDFSERAVQHFGNKFYVNSKAKMQHITDQQERTDYHAIQKIQVMDAIIYFKKRNNYRFAKRDLSLLLLWRLMESLTTTIKCRKLSPIIGYFDGLSHGLRKKCV